MASQADQKPPEPLDVAESVMRHLRVLAVATIVLYLAVGGFAVWTYAQAHRNQVALCTLRGDLESRKKASEGFLKDHPDGFPGVSAATIRVGIENQKHTIAALGGLSC